MPSSGPGNLAGFFYFQIQQGRGTRAPAPAMTRSPLPGSAGDYFYNHLYPQAI